MNARRPGALGVWLGGGADRVGTLVLLPGERIVFSFDPDYLARPDRPTLSLGFKTASGLRAPGASHVRLPPFFSNLLPEGALRDYLAAQAGVKPVREFFLLEALGADLPGAVRVVADGAAPRTSSGPLPPAQVEPPDSTLRFSLAGVQLKFSAVTEAHGGLTIPARGIGGDWIVKLPAERFAGVPEHEDVMLDLAEAAGIAVPEHRLMPVEAIAGLPAQARRLGPLALVVRRFDRGERRVHSEDFAQVFGLYPHEKYRHASAEDLARVLWAEAPRRAAFDFIRRLVFGVITGNADQHVKNWSLRYADGVSADLSPAYDLVSTVVFLPEDQTLGVRIGGAKLMAEVDRAAFVRFADRVGLPRAEVEHEVEEAARASRRALSDHPAMGRLPDAHRASLVAHAASVLGGAG